LLLLQANQNLVEGTEVVQDGVNNELKEKESETIKEIPALESANVYQKTFPDEDVETKSESGKEEEIQGRNRPEIRINGIEDQVEGRNSIEGGDIETLEDLEEQEKENEEKEEEKEEDPGEDSPGEGNPNAIEEDEEQVFLVSDDNELPALQNEVKFNSFAALSQSNPYMVNVGSS